MRYTLRAGESFMVEAQAEAPTTIANGGPSTVYYGTSGVSTSSYVGSIASGASVTLSTTRWLVSAERSVLEIEFGSESASSPPAQGDPHVLRSRVALNVKDYGALGDNTGDDSSAIQDAIDDAYDAGGGVVFLPAGDYRCVSALTLKAAVGLLGEGQTATQISFPTDLGAGVIGITMQGFQLTASWIEKLHIQGAGSSEIGVQNCDMDGVKPGQSSKLTDVSIYGFRAAVKIIQDHQIFTRCMFAHSYWGVLWDEDRESAGNQQFYSCFIEGNNFACVGVLGDAIIDYALFVGGNAAQSPYGFYKGDGPTTGPNALGMMSHTDLIGFAFEGMGNAAFKDASTGGANGADSLTACRIVNPGFVWGHPDIRIDSEPKDYAVDLRNVSGSTIINGSAPFTAGDVAAYRFTGGENNLIDGSVVEDMFAPDCVPIVNWQRAGGITRGRLYNSSGTIEPGDLVEFHSSGSDLVRRYTGSTNYEYAGVAVNDANGRVLIAHEGRANIYCDTSANCGWAVKTGTSTTHHGIAAPGMGFATSEVPALGPIVGTALTNGGPDALVLCHLDHRHDRNFIRPPAVSALPTAAATYRGQLARVEGGSGVADVTYVCQKKADNTYAWQAVTVT